MSDRNPPSSPAQGFTTVEEELSYYKAQYAHLEVELQEFQASSRELEAELEKDVEGAEKRERNLKEKVEALRFEVEEWKTKYKQAKVEASNAQNTLQKEVTALRDGNRTLHLRLRDIEVANDDYERQARNTTSSLEDMESKHNVALERGVMLEEEMKASEQERETLRIEAQRLKEELSDLKIEAEITQEKLRRAEQGHGRGSKRLSGSTETKSLEARSPESVKSLTSSMSTPPVAKSETSMSELETPPSPALSETSGNAKANGHARTPSTKTSKPADSNTTPRPGHFTMSRPRHTRGPSLLPNSGTTPNFMRPTAACPSRPSGVSQEPLPRSGSLYQIRGLIGKMQKLEERVQSARSKLPAPVHTPPHVSPRGSTLTSQLPSNITVRSTKKRTSAAAGSLVTPSRSTTISSTHTASTANEASQARRSRLSYGMSTPNDSSRPSSRASNASQSSQPPPAYGARPSSRASISGLRGLSDQYAAHSAAASRRPRSSMAGDYGEAHSNGHGYGHGHSASTSYRPRSSIAGDYGGLHGSSMMAEGEEDEGEAMATPTQSQLPVSHGMLGSNRRTTLDRSGIPTPSGLGRRQSGNVNLFSQSVSGPPQGVHGAVGLGARKRSALPLRPSTADGGGGDGADLGETF